MKLTCDFPELTALRKKMGAALADWDGTAELNPRERLIVKLIEGIEVELGEVVSKGKLLTYKGEQVILYIKDTRERREVLENEPEKSRRFHIADCSTLEDMRDKGRFERYVVTRRMDGKFLVDWLDPEKFQRGETEAALKVCKNCLTALNYSGYDDRDYATKNNIWRFFSISEFLMEYSTFFHALPSRQDLSATLNTYVEQWSKVSSRQRERKGWQCEQCGVNLSEVRQLLHCHHKNGVVTDNSEANLAVLCALCHIRQPAHSHMRVPSSTESKITWLRTKQGLDIG